MSDLLAFGPNLSVVKDASQLICAAGAAILKAGYFKLVCVEIHQKISILAKFVLWEFFLVMLRRELARLGNAYFGGGGIKISITSNFS